MLRFSKAILQSAVDARIIERNPLKDKNLPTGSPACDKPYISREEIEKVMAACPDYRHHLLLGLCRLAGLRCKSETHTLSWDDVDWNTKRLTVFATKTNSTRQVPIDPDLMPLLEQAFAAAAVGQQRVLDTAATVCSEQSAVP
jgi:integrase